MSNPTIAILNAENNPESFGGVIHTPQNSEGMEVWRFGDRLATRWRGENWNGGYTDFDLQIPLQ